MDKLTQQLADALRAALPHVDRAREVSGGDGDIAAMNARAALRDYDSAQDKTPSQLFREFLAALRATGTNIPSSDDDVALLLRDALDIVQPDGDDDAETATNLYMDFDVVATECRHQIQLEASQRPLPLDLGSPS